MIKDIFKHIPLRSNRFKNTQSLIGFGWKWKVTITTHTVGLQYFNEENTKRHRLILRLDEYGFSTVEIRDFLNLNNIKPPRTNRYSTKLVWMTLKKLKLRSEKFQGVYTCISKSEFYLID